MLIISEELSTYQVLVTVSIGLVPYKCTTVKIDVNNKKFDTTGFLFVEWVIPHVSNLS